MKHSGSFKEKLRPHICLIGSSLHGPLADTHGVSLSGNSLSHMANRLAHGRTAQAAPLPQLGNQGCVYCLLMFPITYKAFYTKHPHTEALSFDLLAFIPSRCPGVTVPVK